MERGRILACSLLWTFAAIHQYFMAFYNISRRGFFSVVLSFLSDCLQAQDGIEMRRKRRTPHAARKQLRVLFLGLLRHKEEFRTHTFSRDLNFSRTEALLLIKCLLWCVLYRTPAISGSVAILKSFFWARVLVPVHSSLDA